MVSSMQSEGQIGHLPDTKSTRSRGEKTRAVKEYDVSELQLSFELFDLVVFSLKSPRLLCLNKRLCFVDVGAEFEDSCIYSPGGIVFDCVEAVSRGVISHVRKSQLRQMCRRLLLSAVF